MLRPLPLVTLCRRLTDELGAIAERPEDGRFSVFELPARKIWRGFSAGLDLAASHHGAIASHPLGPAAGPHTQLAQNIVAAWLAGARIIELKTVQIKDRLVIPRPCIDMATVGFNVEWSQELTLPESAREYVKAHMLIAMLRAGLGGRFALDRGEADASRTVFDLSVGYDLAGIQSAPVQAFLDAMQDASALIDEERGALRAAGGALADLSNIEIPKKLAGSVTLSTFHGCPPDEIESIAAWLMEARGLDVTIKLNPTLLGREDLTRILNDHLGYRDIEVPAAAFDNDPGWAQMVGIVERLSARASALGRGFGVKLTNTLVVRNNRDFFPSSEALMYLSGAPLHVLSLELLARFRERFGEGLPISFSSGVDKQNVAETVACGLVPVTICSDLLQPGGYGRMHGYLAELEQRAHEIGATDLTSFIARWPARGAQSAPTVGPDAAEGRAPDGSSTSNSRRAAAASLADPRYGAAKNGRPPRKLDKTLVTFDCTNCDKCIPVCPNAAIFTVEVERGGRPTPQIGILADACNDCGNCAVFCPEHGGPNLRKPRFHLTLEGFRHEAPRDGLHVFLGEDGRLRLVGRLVGVEHALDLEADGSTPGLVGNAADLAALARAALGAGTWVHASLAGSALSEVHASPPTRPSESAP